ncbi:hypothetical protein OEZ86_010566 [Tetradesmus obliquus]|nr:hypothetical protein OEZ86_010566 [Tetradesmus obliquus]
MKAFALLLLLSGAAAAYASRSPTVGRSLLQTGLTCEVATGCTLCPEGCTTCSRASTSGNFRCTQCKVTAQTGISAASPINRVPAADGSCGCRPGYYIDTVTKDCTECNQHSYCPGGTDAASRKIDCPGGLGTKKAGAIRPADCANRPGSSYNPGTDSNGNNPTQTTCPANTFNTGYNRLNRCTPCPSGMRTDGGLADAEWPEITSVPTGYMRTFTDIAEVNGAVTAAACKVPPGYYVISSNKVVRCPKGEYRAGYTVVGLATSKCDRCPRGTTTFRSGSPSIAYCDQLLPGHYWFFSGNVPAAKYGTTPAVPTSDVTAVCPRGSYCPGGYPSSNIDSGQIQCGAADSSLWTRAAGARSPNDCRVPPGHKYVGGKVVPCATTLGEYFTDWRFPGGITGAPAATTGVDACNMCGASTSSSTVQSDNIEPLATFSTSGFTVTPETIYIPRTTRSCFIDAGEGLVQEKGLYRKVTCNGRNYGAASKAYGLRQSPCTDCPLGMVTDSNDAAYKNTANNAFTDPRACKTPAGFGFDGVQAVICARGTWNDGGADPADRCKPCAEGTTTKTGTYDAINVNGANKCLWTVAGYGRADSVAVTAGAALSLCPKGTHHAGGQVIADPEGVCTSCTNGRTTSGEGSTSAGACDACPPGKGESGSVTAGTCTDCASGYFNDGTSLACNACAGSSIFNFIYPSSNNPITVAATTEQGATSSQQCLLSFASILDSNWYYKGDETSAVSASDFASCMSQCTDLCQFFTYDYGKAGDKCYLTAPAVNDGKVKVAYKVLAGTNLGEERRRSLLAGNRTSGPKTMGSGVWSWFSSSAAAGYGTVLTLSVTTPNIDNCLKACNDEELCAAVVFESTANPQVAIATSSIAVSCSFKQGVSVLPDESLGDTTKRTMLRYRTGTGAASAKPMGA